MAEPPSELALLNQPSLLTDFTTGRSVVIGSRWQPLLLFLALFLFTGCQLVPDENPPATTTITATTTSAPLATNTTTPASTATAITTPAATPIPPTPTQPLPTATATPQPTPCAIPGRIEHGFFNTVLAGPMAYRIYLPPCYGLDGRVYPTLYLLGGNIHDDSIWDTLGVDEAAEAAISAGEMPPFLIVMPDGGWVANQTSGGPASYEGVVINELIPYIEQTYCAWPDSAGRAIGGLSRGGYWSLEIAFRHADMFRSVGGHSFALLDSHAGPGVDPVDTGVTNELGDLRIFLDIGIGIICYRRHFPCMKH
ncbi:MAG: alpha/beta hydrolase-fold protein [Chloroflexota bacterium]